MTRRALQIAVLSILVLAIGQIARSKPDPGDPATQSSVLSLAGAGPVLQTMDLAAFLDAYDPPAMPTEVPTEVPPPPPEPPTATSIPPRQVAAASVATRPAPTPTSGPVRQNAAPPAGMGGQLFAGHNQARVTAGLAAFTLDATLSAAAQTRAQDMATRGYFSHTGPNGSTAFTVLDGLGYRYKLGAENIAMTTYPEAQAATWAMNSWLASPAHRDNIMNPGLNRIGIGVAVSGNTFYFVAIFSD
jgi:uncharacterized protein YkwD